MDERLLQRLMAGHRPRRDRLLAQRHFPIRLVPALHACHGAAGTTEHNPMAQIERLWGNPADMLLPDPGPACEAESMCHVKSVQELEHIKQPRRHCNTGCVKSKRNNGSMRWQASVV